MKRFVLCSTLMFSTLASANFNFYKDFSMKVFNPEKFGTKITSEIFNTNQWPQSFEVNDRNYVVEYTFNKSLEKKIKQYLKRYASDFASVVVIDNNTGKVLSAVDYNKGKKEFGASMSLSTTNPAASVFKVITAANVIENTDVSKETKFAYNGKGTTLYRYQLKNKKNRWTRSIPFKNAFAYSNNVIFGKAAINNSNPASMIKTANKFGFNNELLQILDIGESKLFNAKGQYSLAELASGFNRQTMISPLHGAVIASIIANDGVLKRPNIIEAVKDKKQGREVWHSKDIYKRALSKDSAKELREMMKLTVKRGTARGAFRPWKVKKIKDIEVGGKTGSITGGLPYGKRDWFVSYAKPKNDLDDKGISLCVMIVNVKHWYIKSSHLAKKIIEYYYDDLKSKRS